MLPYLMTRYAQTVGVNRLSRLYIGSYFHARRTGKSPPEAVRMVFVFGWEQCRLESSTARAKKIRISRSNSFFYKGYWYKCFLSKTSSWTHAKRLSGKHSNHWDTRRHNSHAQSRREGSKEEFRLRRTVMLITLERCDPVDKMYRRVKRGWLGRGLGVVGLRIVEPFELGRHPATSL